MALPDKPRLLQRALGWRAVAGMMVLVVALGAAAWFGIAWTSRLDGNRIVVADLVNDSGDSAMRTLADSIVSILRQRTPANE